MNRLGLCLAAFLTSVCTAEAATTSLISTNHSGGFGFRREVGPFSTIFNGPTPQSVTEDFERFSVFGPLAQTSSFTARSNNGSVGISVSNQALRNDGVARVDGGASWQFSFFFCQAVITDACVGPAAESLEARGPAPFVYPNIAADGNIALRGNGIASLQFSVVMNSLLVLATQNELRPSDGDAAGLATGVVSGRTLQPTNQTSNAPFPPLVGSVTNTVRVNASGQVACLEAGCNGQVDANQSVGFVPGEVAFFNVPDDLTVRLPEYYIFDNIYLPPGFVPDDSVNGGGNGNSPVTPIPLPATGWLLIAALGGLVMARRKASTAPRRSSV